MFKSWRGRGEAEWGKCLYQGYFDVSRIATIDLLLTRLFLSHFSTKSWFKMDKEVKLFSPAHALGIQFFVHRNCLISITSDLTSILISNSRFCKLLPIFLSQKMQGLFHLGGKLMRQISLLLIPHSRNSQRLSRTNFSLYINTLIYSRQVVRIKRTIILSITKFSEVNWNNI